MSKRVFEEYDEDRKRLARHLHSTAAQELAALQLNLSLISGDLPSRAAQALAESAQLAQSCAREVRDVCNRLHPPLLEEAGLFAAVVAFANQVGVGFSAENIDPLPPRFALHAFRVIEEVVLYSEKDPEVRIHISRGPEMLFISIAGVGGTRCSVRERVRALDGNWGFYQFGGNRSVRISLPITAEES